MLTPEVSEVLSGGARQWAVVQSDAIAFLDGLPADSVSMVLASPPYCEARWYLENGQKIGADRDCEEWITWMLAVSAAAARVCVGPIFWVVGGVTRDRNYWPACEGLSYLWWKRGGSCQLYRPVVWTRVGIPGSGGTDYLRADWEYVLCLKRPGALPWADNCALGKPPKYAPGGEMSHRLINGERRNQWCGTDTSSGQRRADGTRRKPMGSRPGNKKMYTRNANGVRDSEAGEEYTPPVLANPGNVIKQTYTAAEVAQLLAAYERGDVLHIPVGGGMLGSEKAHENEAPYPESLCSFFVQSFCPPGGVVGDCFSGSGATAKVAVMHGRRFVGCDLRLSQVNLTKRRMQEVDGGLKKDESIPWPKTELFAEWENQL